MLQYVLDRLREPSTYRGLFLIIASMGFTVPDTLQATIVAFIVACIGMFDAIRVERSRRLAAKVAALEAQVQVLK